MRPLVFAPPFDLGIESDAEAGSHVVSLPIARDDGADQVVSVDTRLDALPLGGDIQSRSYKLSFAIIVSPLFSDTDPTYEIQDGRESHRVIPPETRTLIMPIVCASVVLLIEKIRPSLIYRVTKSRHTPAKAMRKHQMITDVIEGLGYRVAQQGTDRHDRLFWVHVR